MGMYSILIVEDDGILCANLQELLLGAGYQIIGALSSGVKALELVKKNPPDLILMDIKLSGEMDGITTVQKIQETAFIPVIYMTAYANDTLIQRAKDTTPYCYLVKPVSEKELLATIQMTFHKYEIEKRLKETQRALRKSEELYRGVVSAVSEGIILQEKGGEISIINESAKELYQLTKGEILGGEDADREWMMYWEDGSPMKGIEHPSYRTLKTGESYQNEIIRYYHPQKGEWWFHFNTSPLYSREKELYGVVISIFNISQRKIAEEQVIDYSRELEKLYCHLDQELDKTRQVHHRFFSQKLPDLEGICLAAYYHPALNLKGDLYNVEVVGNQLVIYVTDVTGYGVDSAMMGIFVKNTISCYLSMYKDGPVTPEGIISFLAEQYTREDFPHDLFISIYVAVLELDSLELSYLGVGFHQLPVLYLEENHRMELSNSDLFITSTISPKEMHLNQGRIHLKPSSTLLLYTDGLTEHVVGKEFFLNRFREVLKKNWNLPPEVVVNSINQEFQHFNRGSLQGEDDITFLVLQIDPDHQKKYHWIFETDLNLLNSIHKRIMNIVAYGGERDGFIMGLHELISNAMEHGNSLNPQKKVVVEIRMTNDYYFASVKDEGEGFPWREKIKIPLDLEGSRDRGRGIPMTVFFCDTLFYNEKGNKAFLKVDRGKGREE